MAFVLRTYEKCNFRTANHFRKHHWNAIVRPVYDIIMLTFFFTFYDVNKIVKSMLVWVDTLNNIYLIFRLLVLLLSV